jgi:UDP-glucose 4-epimerase
MVCHDDEDLTNLASIFSRLRVERADVRDGEGLLQIPRDIKSQRLYHLAAKSSPADSFRDPRLTYDLKVYWEARLSSREVATPRGGREAVGFNLISAPRSGRCV